MDPIDVIAGEVSHLDRADVDTDQIMPKQFLKRVERTGFGQYIFYDWAKEPGWELPANPILATGPNFGSGSSREHAPWALQDYGFQAVVAARAVAKPTATPDNANFFIWFSLGVMTLIGLSGVTHPLSLSLLKWVRLERAMRIGIFP